MRENKGPDTGDKTSCDRSCYDTLLTDKSQ